MRRLPVDTPTARVPMLKVKPGMFVAERRPNGVVADIIIDVIPPRLRQDGTRCPHDGYTLITERYNPFVGNGGLRFGRKSRVRVFKETA